MTEFRGFPSESVKFFFELALNNNKQWFNEHKNDYENNVFKPAQDFVNAMGEQLKKISPNIIGDPRRDKSIFRIYRDTRFSKEKTPYKTHLGILFWESGWEKMEGTGYYFHLEPPELRLYAGSHVFTPDFLKEYRDSVVHPIHGKELRTALNKILDVEGYKISGQHYKRVPRDYNAEHENADLLLHNGIGAGYVTEIPDDIFTENCINYCFEKFKNMSPIVHWIVKMMKRGKPVKS